MRVLPAVILVAAVTALLPWASAAPGHGGATDAPSMQPINYGLSAGQTAGINVSSVGLLPAGGVFVLSISNQGPGPVEVGLYQDTDRVAQWSTPGDGETHVHRTVLPTTGRYNLDFASAEGGQGWFFIDFPGRSVTVDASVRKDLPVDPPGGAGVFPMRTDAAGRYEVVLAEPSAHSLEVALLDSDGTTVLARSETATDGAHVLRWSAEADGRYTLLVQATSSDTSVFSASSMAIVPALSGPLANESPAPPAALLLAAVVTLAAWTRRR